MFSKFWELNVFLQHFSVTGGGQLTRTTRCGKGTRAHHLECWKREMAKISEVNYLNESENYTNLKYQDLIFISFFLSIRIQKARRFRIFKHKKVD